ncbi:hypothetical protein Patl1_08719 [Pistacia atlantica]|nr:hypothetical protein Patl1_08719 [Pistacia atlantica]
MIDVINV